MQCMQLTYVNYSKFLTSHSIPEKMDLIELFFYFPLFTCNVIADTKVVVVVVVFFRSHPNFRTVSQTVKNGMEMLARQATLFLLRILKSSLFQRQPLFLHNFI